MMSFERKVLLDIQLILNGQEWSADTTQAIAELLRENGFAVRDIGEEER